MMCVLLVGSPPQSCAKQTIDSSRSKGPSVLSDRAAHRQRLRPLPVDEDPVPQLEVDEEPQPGAVVADPSAMLRDEAARRGRIDEPAVAGATSQDAVPDDV